MAELWIDLDDDLVAEVARVLGTTSVQETVTAAIQRVVDEHRTRQHSASEDV